MGIPGHPPCLTVNTEKFAACMRRAQRPAILFVLREIELELNGSGDKQGLKRERKQYRKQLAECNE